MASHSSTPPGIRPPTYCRQVEKGRADRAYVRINGKKIKLGVYGSPESHRKYAALISEEDPSLPHTPTISADPTVSELLVHYLEFAKAYYPRKEGRKSEYDDIKHVMRQVWKLAGGVRAKDFGPKRLKEIRQAMIEANHARRYINKNCERIRRMFRWAVEEELVPPAVHTALSAVRGLKRGRSEARETNPIVPVDDQLVDQTLPLMGSVVADMVRLQRLTGMRPAEVCLLRPCDLDRSGEVWVYRPATHKTEHYGKARNVFIGPQGQGVLLRYLARSPEEYCFRPCDSESKRNAFRASARITPLSCGNRVGTNRKNCPRKAPGQRYTTDSYRRAIHYACDKAFPHPEFGAVVRRSLPPNDIEALKKWQSEHRWSPNRLRHAAGTEVRKRFGLEAAQVILGHSSADTTQIYAERDIAKGMDVAKRIG